MDPRQPLPRLPRLQLVLDDVDDAAERCAELDLRVQRALQRRRTARAFRTGQRSPYDALALKLEDACEELARALDHATTRIELDVEDLYAWCAWVAREIDLAEGLALAPFEEWERMEAFAPRALSALDRAERSALEHCDLASIRLTFGAVRAYLGSVLRAAWAA
jgi:hypothetical protein